MAEMQVAAIGVDPDGSTPVLVLREVGARQRLLAVWIGAAEATAIELERMHATLPRPLAHQLVAQILTATGQRLERVCVTTLREGIFQADLLLGSGARVEARVSDAVALALHLDVPIQADESVLDLAVAPEPGDGQLGLPDAEEAAVAELREFLETATPEDF